MRIQDVLRYVLCCSVVVSNSSHQTLRRGSEDNNSKQLSLLSSSNILDGSQSPVQQSLALVDGRQDQIRLLATTVNDWPFCWIHSWLWSLIDFFLFSFEYVQYTITTFAGCCTSGGYGGDATSAINAQLSGPYAVAVDGSGNVYIADTSNFRVRLVNSAGIITTFAGTGTSGSTGDGGAAVIASFGQISGIAVDSNR